MLPYKADIREISHRIETPSIVCVSGGRKYKHWFSLINKLWFVIGANCLKCKLDAN